MANDGFKNYDRWKLMSPEDEENERVRKLEREEYLAEKADYDRDRKKDNADCDRCS